MDKNFLTFAELYRHATESNPGAKIPTCVNDDFCKASPKNINNDILTMVFANMQPLDNIYSTEEALKHGTLFPNLCKPFYGGMKR